MEQPGGCMCARKQREGVSLQPGAADRGPRHRDQQDIKRRLDNARRAPPNRPDRR